MVGMSRPQTNARHANGISTTVATIGTWAILDALPPVVRRALHEAPVCMNPASAHDLVEVYGYEPENAAQALHEAAYKELTAFGAEYQARYGYPLPHIAAHVTPQPYEITPFSSCRPHRRK